MAKPTIGWIGVGRMGYQMVERLIKDGQDVSIWNRTKSKAEPLAKLGGKVVDKLSDLANVDMLFAIVSEGKDLEEVYFGPNGVVTKANGKLPKIFVDCSSISVEDSERIRARLKEKGVEFVCAPVSGNGLVIKAGKLSSVVSGPEAASKLAMPVIEVFAPRGVSYVGEGELARICKIAHNVMLGVVISNLV
jgi:3-hydroxyisobutyrate dehydrogenase